MQCSSFYESGTKKKSGSQTGIEPMTIHHSPSTSIGWLKVTTEASEAGALSLLPIVLQLHADDVS